MRILIFTIVLFFSCQSEDSELHPQILGTWSFIDSDGSYSEIFFNDTILIMINEGNFVVEKFRYQIFRDSLKVFDNIDSSVRYSMIISVIDNKAIELESESGEKFNLNRLNSLSYWTALSNDSIYNEFKIRAEGDSLKL